MCVSVEEIHRYAEEYRVRLLSADQGGMDSAFAVRLEQELASCQDDPVGMLRDLYAWREAANDSVGESKNADGVRELGDFLGQRVLRWLIRSGFSLTEQFTLDQFVYTRALRTEKLFILGGPDGMIEHFRVRIHPRLRGTPITPGDVLRSLSRTNEQVRLWELAGYIVASWRRYCNAVAKAGVLFPCSFEEDTGPSASYDPTAQQSEEDEWADACDRMRRAMNRLGPKHLQLLEEYRVQGLTPRTIAGRRGWSLETTHVYLSRAQSTLRQLYDQE